MLPGDSAQSVRLPRLSVAHALFDDSLPQSVSLTRFCYKPFYSGFIPGYVPLDPLAVYTSELLDYIVPRVLELTYTAWDLQSFAHDLGYDGPPFGWDVDRRFQLRCELDALYFHLYGIAREDVAYIMETFSIVKRKDLAEYGVYRTKETILAIYDELAAAL